VGIECGKMIFMSGSDDCVRDLVRFDCGPSFCQATLLERGFGGKKIESTLDAKFVLFFSSFGRIRYLSAFVLPACVLLALLPNSLC
jgi:hypothetical protein